MAVRVPAWKRLGLKLKFANDKPHGAPDATFTGPHDHDLQASERPTKRRRVAKERIDVSPGQEVIQSSLNDLSPEQTSNAANTKRPIQRKKSVTFSEETKQEDGDSRITIDFPAGSPGSTPKTARTAVQDLQFTGSSKTQPVSEEFSDIGVETTPIKEKKHSKSKTGKKSKHGKATSKDKSNSALEYLSQHRSNRQAWKFNKILDVWIMNHANDAQAIPSAYVPALSGYVRGLPVNAGSRTRLVQECRDALAKSRLDSDAAEQDRKSYIQFIDHQTGPIQNEESVEDFLRSHSRPAVLLWALDENVGDPSKSSSAGSAVQTETNVSARKKKSRTSAPVDISSSSESDSDSDSEIAPKTNGISKVSTDEDETSSSDSSSEDEETSSSSEASSMSSSSSDEEEDD